MQGSRTDGSRISRRDLRRRRRARRLAARGRVARHVPRAHGGRLGRHPRPDELDARRVHGEVYQQVLSGKPRMEGALAALEHFGVPEPEKRVDAYAERKQEMVVDLIEAGKFSAYPDALRFLLAVKDAGIAVAAASSSKNAGLFLRQIRLDEFAEQEGLQLRLDGAGPDAAGRLRRRHLRPPLRARQAASGDLPDRRAGARRRAARGVRRRGRGLGHPGRQGRRVRRRSASRATTTRRCWRRPDADIVVARWTRSTSTAWREGRLARRPD